MRHGGSPKGTRRSSGLDLEVERDTEEVQKGREGAADWTLKWGETRMTSKRDEKKRKVGR